jgi:hypothetical protein
MRTPVGVSSKKRRRRRMALAAKKKKCGAPSKSIVPVQLALKEQRSSWTNTRGVLAALGMLSLIGAGPLNRSDELSLPALDFSRPAIAATESVPRVTAISPNISLKESGGWRTDGLVPNFLPGFAAPLIEPWADLAKTAFLPRLIQPVSWAPLRDAQIGAAIANAPPQDAPPEQFASLDPIGSLRDWPLPDLRINTLADQSAAITPPSSLLAPGSPQIGLHWPRLALVQSGSIGMTMFGFQKFDEFFGRGERTFRAGNDWTRDHTLHFDELIHFQGGYRITQGLVGMYRWAGLNAAWSEGLGAGTAASVMTFLEYVDGRRPGKQGASYSDFTANLLGVGFALAKLHVGALQDVDLRLNYTSFGDVLQKKTLLKYDRMTHWLTYDLQRQLNVPLHVGVGYGVQNAFKPQVRSEYYLGVGFTPVAILERYYPAAAKPFSWLNMYHIGWQVQVK